MVVDRKYREYGVQELTDRPIDLLADRLTDWPTD